VRVYVLYSFNSSPGSRICSLLDSPCARACLKGITHVCGVQRCCGKKIHVLTRLMHITCRVCDTTYKYTNIYTHIHIHTHHNIANSTHAIITHCVRRCTQQREELRAQRQELEQQRDDVQKQYQDTRDLLSTQVCVCMCPRALAATRCTACAQGCLHLCVYIYVYIHIDIDSACAFSTERGKRDLEK